MLRAVRFRGAPHAVFASRAPPYAVFASGAPLRAVLNNRAMALSPSISVIVRARDEGARIGKCLALLRAQRPAGPGLEVIVVDNGSRDQTARIARDYGARVLSLARERFSFGLALNLGAERASGELLVALSADARPRDPGWLGRLAAAFADPLVACASGDRYGPDARPLRKAIRQDLALLQAHPEFGYSNGAGAFRAELWRRRAFRADLSGCEDREWAAFWLRRGWVCVVDPALAVEHDHTHDPLAAIYRRARREAEGFATFLERPPWSLGELLARWWGDTRYYDSALRARLSHRRAARLLGEYAGRRRAGE
jgi:glycosyltransferase involved in cell wall biosynthesis